MLNYVLSYGSHTVFFPCLIWLSSMFGGVIAVCLWVSHSCCWCRGEWPRHTWKLLTEWNVMTEDLSMAYLQGLCKGIDEELVAGMHVCLFLFLVRNIVLGPQIHENGDLMARSSEMKSRSKKWNLIPLRYQNMYIQNHPLLLWQGPCRGRGISSLSDLGEHAQIPPSLQTHLTCWSSAPSLKNLLHGPYCTVGWNAFL